MFCSAFRPIGFVELFAFGESYRSIRDCSRLMFQPLLEYHLAFSNQNKVPNPLAAVFFSPLCFSCSPQTEKDQHPLKPTKLSDGLKNLNHVGQDVDDRCSMGTRWAPKLYIGVMTPPINGLTVWVFPGFVSPRTLGLILYGQGMARV